MKRNISARLKAVFLLIVFFMNMIIGLACAVGICMCCKSSSAEQLKVTTHKRPCHHSGQADKQQESKSPKDQCCNVHIVKFSQVDKSFPESFAGHSSTNFTGLITSFYYFDVLHTSNSFVSIKYFVRSHHPPIPDIRIAIQSFQI